MLVILSDIPIMIILLRMVSFVYKICSFEFNKPRGFWCVYLGCRQLNVFIFNFGICMRILVMDLSVGKKSLFIFLSLKKK